MHSENEGRYMDELNATIESADGKHSIRIHVEKRPIDVPMSEQQPAAIKNAFNMLLTRLRDHGKFKIVISNVGSDLFSQVAKEYIGQLNQELLEVHAEMHKHGLASK